MTSTVGPAATPAVNLSTSATNQIVEETTLVPSAQKYPSCNLALPSLTPLHTHPHSQPV